MESYSLEQLEVLVFVATAEEPLTTAVMAHRRWRYILAVAEAASQGQVLDSALSQVIERPQEYKGRAEAILAVLTEWLQDYGFKTSLGMVPWERPDQTGEVAP